MQHMVKSHRYNMHRLALYNITRSNRASLNQFFLDTTVIYTYIHDIRYYTIKIFTVHFR
jgi:hypothetical protein